MTLAGLFPAVHVTVMLEKLTAVQVEAAGDICATTAVASWAAGRYNVLPAFSTTGSLSATTTVKTTAARDISIVIATATLTAGVFKVVLFYHDPQTP